jgi:hypothetical protein
MRLVPRRQRFPAMMLAARAITPLVRRLEALRPRGGTRIDTAGDLAAHFVTHVLTKNGVPYDPVVDFDGYDGFVRAYREGRGLLLASPHAALGLMSIRYNHDHGLRPITITSDPMRIPGTRILHDTIQPSPSFFVTVRQRLREGRLVGAMLDRVAHHGGRTFEVATVNGPLIVSPALLTLAARCGARVAFIEIHAERGRLAGKLVVATSETAEGLTREYVEFVRAHVDVRFGGASAPPELRQPVSV